MIDYFQPPFYRFTTDSIWLADTAAQKFKSSKQKIKVLDICSGSGVIGLEILQKRQDVEALDFIEIQADFIPYFEKNRELFAKETKVNFHHKDIRDFETDKKFDLIVCNPPYFLKGSGLIPDDARREICRFADANFEEILLNKARHLLTNEGQFYFLSQSNHENLELVSRRGRTSIFLFEDKAK
jgi:tRNA1Val (adenine37-N6)-methyltransferase